jgi:hypothetical protein
MEVPAPGGKRASEVNSDYRHRVFSAFPREASLHHWASPLTQLRPLSYILRCSLRVNPLYPCCRLGSGAARRSFLVGINPALRQALSPVWLFRGLHLFGVPQEPLSDLEYLNKKALSHETRISQAGQSWPYRRGSSNGYLPASPLTASSVQRP